MGYWSLFGLGGPVMTALFVGFVVVTGFHAGYTGAANADLALEPCETEEQPELTGVAATFNESTNGVFDRSTSEECDPDNPAFQAANQTVVTMVEHVYMPWYEVGETVRERQEGTA